MMKVTELRIEVKRSNLVALARTNPGIGTAGAIPPVVLFGVVTDRLLVSDEGVRVLVTSR